MTPAGLMNAQAGCPEAVQVNGAVPPVAANENPLIAVLFFALHVFVVTCRFTMSDAVPVAVAPELSVNVKPMENVPATVGVPEMTPPALIVKPDGRPLADHVYGAVPEVPATVALYATFCTPLGRVVVVTDGPGLMTTE